MNNPPAAGAPAIPDWLQGATYPWADERATLLFQLLTRNVPLSASILPLAQQAGIDLSRLRVARGAETWADILEATVGDPATLSKLFQIFEAKVPAAKDSLQALLTAPRPPGGQAALLPTHRSSILQTREDLRRFLIDHRSVIVAYYNDHRSLRAAATNLGEPGFGAIAELRWVLLPERNDPRTGFPEEGPCLVEYQDQDIVRRITL